MANWLDKYEQGGLVLKKKTKDNYDLKGNYNDAKAYVGPGYVGDGYDTTGRNYSPAWGGSFQTGGSLPGAVGHMYARLQNGDALPEVVMTASKKPKANVLVHDPQDYDGGHKYSLKRTVTPYKSNRQIKLNTEAVDNPNDIDFLYNYRHTANNTMNETAVPYEGDKHWNIDRFITDPAFGKDYNKLNVEDNSMEAERRNVLADMFKYQMYQHPEQSRGKSFRQAKHFVRNEIDPRVNGPYFQNYMRHESDYPVGTGGLTTFTNSNPFFAAWETMQMEEDQSNREYRKNPWDDAKVEEVAKDYLRNTKKLSRKETKAQIEKWKDESKSKIENYQKPLVKDPNVPITYNTGDEAKDYILNYPKEAAEAYFNLLKENKKSQLPNKKIAMGGSIPGAVGFMYARTAGAAPSNGKHAKKTKASAQNGTEMAFYQNGLDWKPKSISKNGSVIKDDMGQWAHPGEVTEIGSNNITMQGVDYPVLGVSDTGDTKLMQPGKDYKFKGSKVTEYPKGGWLNKYK